MTTKIKSSNLSPLMADASFVTGSFSGDLTIADKIVHSGDTNTAIRFPATDTVTVETSGAERLRIDASGNIGIGTTTPAAKLQIEQNQAALTYTDIINITSGGGVVFRQIVRNVANTGTTSVDYAKLPGGAFVINNNDTNTANYTAFGVGASERMRIDANGAVTKPFQPAFIAKGLAGGGNVTYTSGQVIIFNTAAYNIGSGYNTSTGRFTAPVAGLYHFSYQIYLNPGTTNSPIVFTKNGVIEIFFLQGTAQNGIGLSTIISMAANDYVDVRVRNIAGATATVFVGGDHTQFTGYLIG